MNEPINGKAVPTPDLAALLTAMRPRLHRFAARMTGSVIEGEDVVQETVLKALEARPEAAIENPEAWVFRIARNTALDLLRRRGRERPFEEDEAEARADPVMDTDRAYVAAAGLRSFMDLPPAQRASVILMDVIGYSLEEIADILDMTVPAVKAALHRGRGGLKASAERPPEGRPIVLKDDDRQRLAGYVERFNARDFDGIRALLAEDVRVEVRGNWMNGKKPSGRYFTRYSELTDWRLVAATIEGQPAALVYGDNGTLKYFILMKWRGGEVVEIRDYHASPYLLESADPVAL